MSDFEFMEKYGEDGSIYLGDFELQELQEKLDKEEEEEDEEDN